MGAVGNEPHQKEATATYRGHHQKRGGALGKIAQSYKGYREDGFFRKNELNVSLKLIN
jgi:hypothetical protein